jgi:hypothetical protein
MMYRPTDMHGGVTLGGRMSCSRCYRELDSWDLTVARSAEDLHRVPYLAETVASLTTAMLARNTACSSCAEDLAGAIVNDDLEV